MNIGRKYWMLCWSNKSGMLLLRCFCCCCWKKYDKKKEQDFDIDDSQRTLEEVNDEDDTSISHDSSSPQSYHEMHLHNKTSSEWKRAESTLETYRVFDKETILPTYYEWIIEQDRIHAKCQNKEYAYYGPIGGSETFLFWGSKIQVRHCTTNSILDLGYTSFSVVGMMMSKEQKQQLRSWLDFELLDDYRDNSSSLEELSKSLIISVTPTSIGRVIKVTVPTTGRTIDLSDYDDW